MDELFNHKFRIASARLAGYDYGSNGMYFITICAQDRESYFGEIITQDDAVTVQPSVLGQVVLDCWLAIPTFFPFVFLDAFQLMPDHVHGVVWICKPDAEEKAWQPNQFGPQRQNLASIIRDFKSGVKKYATMNQIEFGWQSRYYDRVIRNTSELNRIRTYIDENPAKWIAEQNNPENLYR